MEDEIRVRQTHILDPSRLRARYHSLKQRSLNLFTELYREWAPYPPTAERRAAPEFVFYLPGELNPVPVSIKNISSTGVYLYTDMRWLPGAVIPLTLQRNGPFEVNPEQRVTLKARVIRSGQDGVGLAFALPGELNFNLWRSAIENTTDRKGAHDILEPFRMAEALTFLSSICPGEAQELRELFLIGLSNARAANAVEIVLEAELFLASHPGAELMRAEPKVMQRIIQDGSWVDEGWIRRLWAGLLTTYCTAGPKVNSDLDLVALFSPLTPVHVMLLKAACIRAKKSFSAGGAVSAQPLELRLQELQTITGIQSVGKLERDIHHLATVGLIEPAARIESMMAAREVTITPSALGLALFARWYGHRGAVEDFYRAELYGSRLRAL